MEYTGAKNGDDAPPFQDTRGKRHCLLKVMIMKVSFLSLAN